ncbi:hypothetical protein WA588_004880, partial [Blastocystis sp. NMH]
MNSNRVLVCFFLQEAFSCDGKELPSLAYESVCRGSAFRGNPSRVTELGHQYWTDNTKHMWFFDADAYSSAWRERSEDITVTVFPYTEGDSKDHPLSVFHLPLPEVNDNIDWNMLYEASSDDIRYHIHLHAQPYYIDAVSQPYKESRVGNVICLTPEQVSAASACDYDFTVTVDALTNWSDIVTSLQTSGFQSSHYVLTTVFGHAYTSSPHVSFDGGDALLRLDPVALHGSVHLISRFLQSLEPPTIVLANASQQSLCSFRPDFERFALSLACCPDDASVLANTAAVCVGTMELRNLLDCSEKCPAVFKNLVHTGCRLSLRMSLRKREGERVQMSALAPREVHGGVKNDNAVNTNATMNNNASMNTNTTMNNNASVNTNTTMNNNASVNTNTTMNNNASMNTNTIPHNTNTNHTDANDIQSLTIQKTLLERKLQNMEEYQRETVKHYEQELEAKQRTILRLTQANREFEQLCVGTITGTGDAAKLREENERLKKRVAELEAQVTELEEDKDKMR